MASLVIVKPSPKSVCPEPFDRLRINFAVIFDSPRAMLRDNTRESG